MATTLQASPTTRVIFLDYDGVLNSYLTQPAKDKGGIFGLHYALVRRLNTLVARTGAAIVVSSSWRNGTMWEEALYTAGFEGEVLGKTGNHQSRFRGEEVDMWLNDHPEIEKYAILDDDHDFYPWQPVWHPSIFEGGLTPEIVERVAFHFACA